VRSHADTEAMSIATLGLLWLISSFGHAGIITSKHGFVTVGASFDILFSVEKLWIMTTWTSYQHGKQCLEN
jgi:hypothetical protein